MNGAIGSIMKRLVVVTLILSLGACSSLLDGQNIER
jgi:hypothetical protein